MIAELLAITETFTLKDIMGGGAYGLLTYIIWWGTNRLAKSIDDQRESNDNLAKAVAALILKHRYPEADVTQDAREILDDVKSREKK